MIKNVEKLGFLGASRLVFFVFRSFLYTVSRRDLLEMKVAKCLRELLGKFFGKLN